MTTIGFESHLYVLIAASAAGSVIMLAIFGLSVNSKKVSGAKSLVTGRLLEAWLFRHDLALLLSAQIKLIAAALRLSAVVFIPVCLAIIPLWLLYTWTAERYGTRPLVTGEKAVVAVRLAENRGEACRLESSDGITIETPPLRADGGKEIYWRISVKEKGVHSLFLRIGGNTVTLPVAAKAGIPVIGSPMPSYIRSFGVDYPRMEFFLAGFELGAGQFFIIFSTGIAILLFLFPFRLFRGLLKISK